ncbi:MAG: hypothetical protein LBV15_04585 [Planctomycetota bacterium]|jgi:hypothetical protein|nr:hypothetical protein [Planctomycetota bacterium]
MRKLFDWLLAVLVLFSPASLMGLEACPPPPPKEKWLEVCETIQVPVAVTEYVEEPCEVKVTRMIPVEKEVTAKSGKWVYEDKQVPCLKRVTVCEEYTVNETRYEIRPETRMRKVPRIVCEEVEKTVVDRVPEEICDPASGRIIRRWREECRMVVVPVERRIMVDEEYTVNVRCPVQVPVARSRRVVKEVPDTRLVRTPKYVCENVTKTVKVLEPSVETRTVMRKRAVKTTRMVEKQVVKRVKVPAGPDC